MVLSMREVIVELVGGLGQDGPERRTGGSAMQSVESRNPSSLLMERVARGVQSTKLVGNGSPLGPFSPSYFELFALDPASSWTNKRDVNRRYSPFVSRWWFGKSTAISSFEFLRRLLGQHGIYGSSFARAALRDANIGASSSSLSLGQTHERIPTACSTAILE